MPFPAFILWVLVAFQYGAYSAEIFLRNVADVGGQDETRDS